MKKLFSRFKRGILRSIAGESTVIVFSIAVHQTSWRKSLDFLRGHSESVHPEAICSGAANDLSYERRSLGEKMGFNSLTHHSGFHSPALFLIFGH